MKYRTLSMVVLTFALLTACATGRAVPEVENEQDTAPVESVVEEAPADAIKLGVLSIRSASATNAQWGPLVDYLTEATGQPFALVVLSFDDQFGQVEQGRLDFVLSNPLASTQLQRLYNTEFIATLSKPNTGTQFSGLIIVSQDSDISSLEDLKGKAGACVSFETGAGGCLFQTYHLQQQGIDPFSDFASFVEIPSQDNIVLSVLNGTIDVGFVRTGQLEKMVNDGTLLGVDDVRILDQAEDDFYYPHTTILYPEWPFAALEGTDPELVATVQQALLDIPADHPALEAAGIDAFVSDVDYQPMHTLIETLGLLSSEVAQE